MSLRIQCVQTIQKIIEEKAFFKTLKNTFKTEDSAFANHLILTALRRKAAIDQLLSSLILKKIPNKNKVLEYVLLLGSTEILYTSTPDYAVINEYVNIAKKLTGKFAANMVNAVLRKVVLHKEEMQNKALFPQNFKNILKNDYTKEQINKMEQMLLYEAPIDLTLKNQNLAPDGLAFENGTLRLSHEKCGIESLKGYNEGAFFVQDLASSLPVSFISDLKGKNVLDLCAAPGGKTAQLLIKGAEVTAVDISMERMDTLKENMARLHLAQNLKTVVSDAIPFLENLTEKFDLILIDAPCSATGTFRKHPEVLHIKTIDDVKKMLSLQQELLEKASKHLLQSGHLLYCTCSISKDEGERQIEQFLKLNPNFEIEPFNFSNLHAFDAKKIDRQIVDNQVLRTLPYHMKNDGGMDSFFAACLKRK